MFRSILSFKHAWRGIPWMAIACAVLTVAMGAGNAGAAPTPEQDVQAKLEAAQKRKYAAETELALVGGKLGELSTALGDLKMTKERLEKQQLRFKGIQLWNGFVGFIGVFNDTLNKANPGTQAVVAACTFLQDRVAGDLADQGTRMQAKVKRFSELSSSMSGKLREVQDVLAMDEMAIAKKLVDDGSVKLVDTPLVRMPWTTPLDSVEAVSKSAAVVTGKVRYLLEAIGPAIKEVGEFIRELEALIEELKRRQQELVTELKRADEEVRSWEGQLRGLGYIRMEKELEESRAAEQRLNQAMAAAKGASGEFAYSPIDRNRLLGPLRAACDLITPNVSSGRSYDREEFYRLIELYREVRDQVYKEVEAKSKTVEEKVHKMIERINARYEPLIAAAVAAGKHDQASKLRSEQYEVQDRTVIKPRDKYFEASSADLRGCSAEADRLLAEAAVNAAKLDRLIAENMKKLKDETAHQIGLQVRELERLQARKAAEVTPSPWGAWFPRLYGAEQARFFKGLTVDRPGIITAQNEAIFSELKAYGPQLIRSVAVLEEIVKAEEKICAEIENYLTRMWNSYKRVAPPKLLTLDKAPEWPKNSRLYPTQLGLHTGWFSYAQIGVASQYFSFTLPAVNSHEALDDYRKFLKEYEIEMPILEQLLDDDWRALEIAALSKRLNEALKDFSFRGDWELEKDLAKRRFAQKNGQTVPQLKVDESDGVAFLNQMKQAWNELKADVEKLVKLGKAGTSKLFFNLGGPGDHAGVIANLAKIPEKIEFYEKMLEEIKGGGGSMADKLKLINQFYQDFRKVYESRQESKVMAMISDDWEAGDGTTLGDLAVNLGRTFNVFDRVQYNIQNIQATAVGADRFRVTYDVVITSRILRRNVKHEEKSSVAEELVLDKSGRLKIARTLSGRFWYVE